VSRSKRKKRTRLCACGVRIETSDRGAHDMCFDKRKSNKTNQKTEGAEMVDILRAIVRPWRT